MIAGQPPLVVPAGATGVVLVDARSGRVSARWPKLRRAVAVGWAAPR